MASSKSHLYEICAANDWEPPSFECCEAGPSHKKLFTFKVTVEMRLQDSVRVLECCGAAQPRKKAAAEHAAEGALWCLRNLGYQLKHN